MNVKPIPTSPGQRQSPNHEEKDKKSPGKKEAASEQTAAAEQSAEAADEALRNSQPTDTQTVVELLTHPMHQATPAKFPTPKRVIPPSESAKKLNRNA